MPDTVTHAFQRVAAELFNELLQVCSGIPQKFFINLQYDDFRFQKIAYFNASISTNGHVENHLYSNLGIRHTCYKEFVIGHNRDIMKSIQWSQRIRYTQVLLYLYIYNVNLVSLRLVYYFGFFFTGQGDKYWKFFNRRRIYGPNDIKQGFRGVPDNVEAAMVWGGNGKTYFFKGIHLC